MNFCIGCYAAYESDYPMDSCENLLCEGKTVLIDPVSVLILAKLQKICFFYNLKQTVMLADTLNFYEIGMAFSTPEDGADFLRRSEELLRDKKYKGKIDVDEHEDAKGFFCIDIGIAVVDGFEQFVRLESVEKVERIFTLLMFLCELFDIPTDLEAISAFSESECTEQVVTTGEIS